MACREPALSLPLLLPLPLLPPLLLLAELQGVSIPGSRYPAPPHLPLVLAHTDLPTPGNKSGPARPLLQPEDDSGGLSEECDPRRLEGRRCCACCPGVGVSEWVRRLGEAATGTSVLLALPGRRGGHLERCAPAPVARPPWAGAALPPPRGSPLGGNPRQRRKSLQLNPGLRRAARGTGGARLAEKRRPLRCAQSFGRSGRRSEGHGAEPPSCGQSRRATLGPPSMSRRLGRVAFAPPTPAEAGWTRSL